VYWAIGAIICVIISVIGIFFQILGMCSEKIKQRVWIGNSRDPHPILFLFLLTAVISIAGWPLVIFCVISYLICLKIGPIIDSFEIKKKDPK
jgi:uncharacterized membrane protein YdjX (TVP38/TMEM64 family)